MHETTSQPPGRWRCKRSATVPVVLALLVVGCTRSSSEAPTGSISGGPVAIGDVAPAFSLPSASGEDVSLADFAGKKAVLLYFSMGPG